MTHINTIQLHNVSKTFTYYKKSEGLAGTFKALFHREKLSKEAVRTISFEIQRGEFVGFLGPNGAGKTTTLKMLSGILYPTSGRITVLGHTPSKREDAFKKQFSIVMGQKSQLWSTLPAVETLNLLHYVYEIPHSTYRRRLKELTSLMEIEDLLHVQVRKLSLGQRMKFELVASLLHDPKILFLDEPTIGLDIVSQQNIRSFLRDYNRKHEVTILLTSHYMDDVEDLCSRIIIMNDGKLGYDGPVSDILAEYGKDKNVKVVFEKKISKKDLSELGKVTSCSSYEASISMPIETAQRSIASLLARFPVKDITINDVTLEEVVAKLFRQKQ